MGIESPDGVAGIGGLLRDAFDTLRSNLEQLTEEQAIANGKKEQLETELSHQSSLCEVSRLWSVENVSVRPSLCLSSFVKACLGWYAISVARGKLTANILPVLTKPGFNALV